MAKKPTASKKRKYPPKKLGLIGSLVKGVQRKVRRTRGRRALSGINIEKMYNTGRRSAMEKFGKAFTKGFPERKFKGTNDANFVVDLTRSSYESHLAISLMTSVEGAKLPTTQAKLGFEENAVVIEAMQGNKGMKAELDRFRQSKDNPQRMPGPNFLVAVIEARAKEKGFKQVKIRVPESLHYYHHPVGEAALNPKEHRLRMEALYGRVAKAMGYRKKGMFFVKTL